MNGSPTNSFRPDIWPARGGRLHLRLRIVGFFEVPGGSLHTNLANVEALLCEHDAEVVQSIYGVVLAVFGSASGCYSACRRLPPAVRAGVSCGDILYEDGLVHGLPVIEASRLHDAAGDGEILWALRAQRVAPLPEHAFAAPRELSLQGLPPLAASALLHGSVSPGDPHDALAHAGER